MLAGGEPLPLMAVDRPAPSLASLSSVSHHWSGALSGGQSQPSLSPLASQPGLQPLTTQNQSVSSLSSLSSAPPSISASRSPQVDLNHRSLSSGLDRPSLSSLATQNQSLSSLSSVQPSIPADRSPQAAIGFGQCSLSSGLYQPSLSSLTTQNQSLSSLSDAPPSTSADWSPQASTGSGQSSVSGGLSLSSLSSLTTQNQSLSTLSGLSDVLPSVATDWSSQAERPQCHSSLSAGTNRPLLSSLQSLTTQNQPLSSLSSLSSALPTVSEDHLSQASTGLCQGRHSLSSPAAQNQSLSSLSRLASAPLPSPSMQQSAAPVTTLSLSSFASEARSLSAPHAGMTSVSLGSLHTMEAVRLSDFAPQGCSNNSLLTSSDSTLLQHQIKPVSSLCATSSASSTKKPCVAESVESNESHSSHFGIAHHGLLVRMHCDADNRNSRSSNRVDVVAEVLPPRSRDASMKKPSAFAHAMTTKMPPRKSRCGNMVPAWLKDRPPVGSDVQTFDFNTPSPDDIAREKRGTGHVVRMHLG